MRTPDNKTELTNFIVSTPFSERLDLKTDGVVISGKTDDLDLTIKSWREKSYKIHFLTGILCGCFSDYFSGAYDGTKHYDEIQTSREGAYILNNPSLPYAVPTYGFIEYRFEQLKKVIDAGIDSIYVVSPELFVKSGYSDSFKKEWAVYFGEEWEEPHSSVDAAFKASKLKVYLAKRCVSVLSEKLRMYSLEKYGRHIEIIAVSKSVLRYCRLNVISLGSALSASPYIDGFLANVSSSSDKMTSVYRGIRRERTFLSTVLEYGEVDSLVRGTDKNVCFLHDPIGDSPLSTWDEYKRKYIKTLTASLFYDRACKYTVCAYAEKLIASENAKQNGNTDKVMPLEYKTVFNTAINLLRNMDNSPVVSPDVNKPIAVIISDTAMYQRVYPDNDRYSLAYSEAIDSFSCFYGMCIPFLQRGVPIVPVGLENITRPDALSDYKVIVMSYEFMKPLDPSVHYVLQSWISKGGVLVYIGDGSDSFNRIKEWWNKDGLHYDNPAEHLFDTLGVLTRIKSMRKKANKLGYIAKTGTFDIGKGSLVLFEENPSRCAHEDVSVHLLRKTLFAAAERKGIAFEPTDCFTVRRGHYMLISMLNDDNTKTRSFSGFFVDLLSDGYDIYTTVNAAPDTQWLLYDLDSKTDDEIEIIALSAKLVSTERSDRQTVFTVLSQEGTVCSCRMYCTDVISLFVNDKEIRYTRDISQKTLFFRFTAKEENEIKVTLI